MDGSAIGLTPELAQSGVMWPFAPRVLPTHEYATQILVQLPSYERARAITEMFFVNFSWIRCPVDHDQLYSELLPLFYPHDTQNSQVTNNSLGTENYHDLALLFAVLACGTVSDLSQTPDNEEASRYNVLSRAALGLQSVFEEASLSSVQAVFLLGTYEGYAGRGGTLDTAWRTTSLALFLSSSVCFQVFRLLPAADYYSYGRLDCVCILSERPNRSSPITPDRDPERWKLDDRIIQRRRLVFWEMYLADHWRVCYLLSFHWLADSSYRA